MTASPVLTNEVSRYYQNLVKRIKSQVKKNEGKPIKKKEEESPSKGQESFEVIGEINTEKTPIAEKVEKDEQEEEFNEEDYLMDEEEAEMMSKMNKNYSLEDIPVSFLFFIRIIY